MNEEDEELQLLAEQWMESLEIQIKDFLDRYYEKPYTLDKRVKSVDKLRLKQKIFSNKVGFQVPLEYLPDIIGFRISVESEEDVEKVCKIIDESMLPDLIIDHFNEPTDTGFKAYLYHFKKFEVNTEIQIMTERMREWTNATHDDYNDRKYFSK